MKSLRSINLRYCKEHEARRGNLPQKNLESEHFSGEKSEDPCLPAPSRAMCDREKRTPRSGEWQSLSTLFVETWIFTFSFRCRSVKRRRSLRLARDDNQYEENRERDGMCYAIAPAQSLRKDTLIYKPFNAGGEPGVIFQADGEILDSTLLISHGDLRNTAPVVAFF